ESRLLRIRAGNPAGAGPRGAGRLAAGGGSDRQAAVGEPKSRSGDTRYAERRLPGRDPWQLEMARCAAGRELANRGRTPEEPAGNARRIRYGRDHLLAGKGRSQADRGTATKACARQRARAQEVVNYYVSVESSVGR